MEDNAKELESNVTITRDDKKTKEIENLFTEEELREMILEEMNKELTFESVITAKLEEEKAIEESFIFTGQGYETAKLINDDAYRLVTSSKRFLNRSIKFFKLFKLDESTTKNLIEFEKILTSRQESLLKDKEFLITIKNLLYILKLYSSPELNYEICDILEKICIKSSSIINSIDDGMKESGVE